MITGRGNAIYLPSLHGVRALGALVVLISHVEQIKSDFNFSHTYWSPIPGRIGVVLFFVLSGFLISYLLIAEQTFAKKIDIGKFYIRRILRIWPLYYLIVLLSLFVFNKVGFLEIPIKSADVYTDFREKLLLYVCMLPNLVMIPYAAQAWSVGIEEQFYLVYPVLTKFIKHPILLLAVLLLVVFSPEILATIIEVKFIQQHLKILIILNLVHTFSLSFSCIAIGCAGAWIVWHKGSEMIQFIYKKEVQIASVLALIILFFLTEENKVAGDLRVYAVLFCILIINMSTNPNSLFSLENKVMRFLGRISYGLYMYHPVTIVIALQLIRTVIPTDFQYWPANVLLYVSSVTFTVGVAAFSYEYLEKPFLLLKPRFSNINSAEARALYTETLQETHKKHSVLTR